MSKIQKTTTINSVQVQEGDKVECTSNFSLSGEFTAPEMLMHISTNLIALAQSLQKLGQQMNQAQEEAKSE